VSGEAASVNKLTLSRQVVNWLYFGSALSLWKGFFLMDAIGAETAVERE